jgi:ABC-type multidrug transport system fused ATPase/permease subunit
MQNRTVLVIAHRYNTISHAQQIAVLEDGQLVEIGQPAALAQINGPYSRFIDACRMV